MYGGDEVSAVVVEIGSVTTKVGYAGEDSPKAVFPTVVGVRTGIEGKENYVGKGSTGIGERDDTELKDTEKRENLTKKPNSFDGNENNKQYYVGTNELSFRRDNLEISNPLSKGLIRDWEQVEKLLEHGINDRLLISLSEHPLMMAEPSFNTRNNREKLSELLFEKYQLPALFLSKNAVLSACASGRGTALVFDSGGGITCAVPVQDGFVLNKGIIKSTFAGERITWEIRNRLHKRGITIRAPYTVKKKFVYGHQQQTQQIIGSPNFPYHVSYLNFPNTTDSYENWRIDQVCSDIKESVLRVPESHFDETHHTNLPTVSYDLPDCQIEVGPERFSVPELLFDPSPLINDIRSKGGMVDSGFDTPLIGCHSMIHNSIMNCDVDIRRELYNNIVLTGGNTLLSGFSDRILKELNEFSPPHKLKIIATNFTAERKFGVWIGGSILASLGAFHQMWMSKMEYEEYGKSLVERKCP